MENLIELGKENSLIGELILELRSTQLQADRHRFRENIEQIGLLMAYEISKSLRYKEVQVQTPLALATAKIIEENMVIAAILRAALPLQAGFLKGFRKADAAFIAAYRKHSNELDFEIVSEYEAKPNLFNKTLLLVDPMCATGQSFITCYNKLIVEQKPEKVIFASIFSSKKGIATIATFLPEIVHYTCVVDLELNAKSYIVPGLGDAGDLAFGKKM